MLALKPLSLLNDLEMDLTPAIKAQAADLGFSLIGVTTADPLPHAPVFENWLDQGRQAEMHYLDTPRSRQCRAHPDLLLPGCRSVLVLGVRYPAPIPREPNNPSGSLVKGRVAAYAWSVDYHEFLSDRLRSMVSFIEQTVGHSVPNRWYTDTGPVLERELAQRAGLGWIGKNTCLINPRHGSYFLLAEILLGIELEPDVPFVQDLCGTCTRCLQACPTGCILPDRTLDSGRCISYLTIELKGTIPTPLRPLMDGWVFGCDICQQVCPWNRFAIDPVDSAFDARLVSPEPDLMAELRLTNQEFSQKYCHSPLRRTRRSGYLRNITVALGNLQDPAAIPDLAHSLQSDSDALVRSHAAWALGRLSDPIARQSLSIAKQDERDPRVLLEIEYSLSSSGGS